MIALLRRCRSDDGIGMVELIVSIALTSVVLAMVGSFFVGIAKSSAAGQTTRSATGTAATAMDEIREVLREGCDVTDTNGTAQPAVLAGTAGALTVTALVDTSPTAPAPTKVGLSVNSNGYLVETRTAGVVASGVWTFTGAVTTRTVAGPLTASTTSFAYLDGNNVAITPSGSGLTAVQRAAVSAITVTVTVPSTTFGSGDPVVLTNTIDVPGFPVTAS